MGPRLMDAPAPDATRTVAPRRANRRPAGDRPATDRIDEIRELGPAWALRAVSTDMRGEFVTESYEDMKAVRLFSAHIPEVLGGGGASHGEMCDIIREIAKYDGSTALAFAMHTHPVAANVFKYLRGDPNARVALVKIAAGELVIAGTGATDWLGSSGSAERVDGGFRVSAQKRFVSGSSGADLFVTSARHEGPDGSEVIHFAVPFSHEAVRVHDNWDALGMRGTGSNNVTIEDLFVADGSIVVRRPADEWHAMWNVILPIALPLIVSAYVGLAEAAAEQAIQSAKKSGPEYAPEVGEMLSQLTIAQLALADMMRAVADYDFEPSLDGTDATLTRKAIATEAVKAVLEVATDLVGGKGFLRGDPLERIVRDVRAAHFHPLPARKQRRFSGRLAMGMDPA